MCVPSLSVVAVAVVLVAVVATLLLLLLVAAIVVVVGLAGMHVGGTKLSAQLTAHTQLA